MNRIKNILCGFSLIISGLPLISYATQDACPFDSVHCAYMSGLNSNEGGRLIKLSNRYIGSLVNVSQLKNSYPACDTLEKTHRL